MISANTIQSTLITELRKQYPTINIKVKQLDGSLYEVWIKEISTGTPQIEGVMQRFFPEAQPFSGIGLQDGGFRQSFTF